jgi:HlyD family secretion protein
MITAERSRTLPVAAGLLGLLATVTMLLTSSGRAQYRPGPVGEDDKRWRVIAPGEIEPASGAIKIGSSVPGRIAEVSVRVNDVVFAGELLVRLEDDDLRAKVAEAEAQVALQRHMRNEGAGSAGRAADRRQAEDAVADAEKAVINARSAVDRAAVAKRTGNGSDGPLATARAALARAQDRLKQQQSELRAGSMWRAPHWHMPTLCWKR